MKSFEGTVRSGTGKGKMYLAMPGYQKHFNEALGFAPYAGTLNLGVELPSREAFIEAITEIRIPEFDDNGEKRVGVSCYPIRINSLPAAIIVPDITEHPDSIVEIIAPQYLRDELNISDGDTLTLSANERLVMVFGVFDGLDAGHQFLLREAKKLGDTLIAVVAHDEAVGTIKKKNAFNSHEKRIQDIQESGLADIVVLGDSTQHTWNVLRRYRPAIIALGHDQDALAEALKNDKQNLNFSFEMTQLPEYV